LRHFADPVTTSIFYSFRMGLFSFLRKNKQDASSGNSEFYSRAEDDSGAVRNGNSRRRRKQGKAAESEDPVLPEKKRARRRLVGAVALVLAAVIGLPMLLDSEPKPVADDIAIQIPSKDKSPAQASAPNRAASAASPVAASATLDKKEQMVEIPPPVATAPAQVEAAAAPAASKDDKAANAKAASKPDTKPESTHKPEAAKSVEKSDDVRAVALLEGKSDAKSAADKKSEKIVLQVGAFATKEKVDEVRNKLKKAGVQTYTEKVPAKSGDVMRIRVGPLASKDEAAKMHAKLAKLGFDAKNVTGEH
jgi:DedD protein